MNRTGQLLVFKYPIVLVPTTFVSYGSPSAGRGKGPNFVYFFKKVMGLHSDI